MAIAIPMISGAIEAANNVKCRSNLKQLHAALIAFVKLDNQALPSLANNPDLTILVDNGYLDENSKLTDCPGEDGKQKPSDSSYVGGEKLNGINHLLELTDNDIILSDKSDAHHKSGKNAILLDGSFNPQSSGGGAAAVVPDPKPDNSPLEKEERGEDEGIQAVFQAVERNNLDEVRRLLALKPPLNLNQGVVGLRTVLIAACFLLRDNQDNRNNTGKIMAVIGTILSYGADPNFKPGDESAREFVQRNHIGLVKELKDRLLRLFNNPPVRP